MKSKLRTSFYLMFKLHHLKVKHEQSLSTSRRFLGTLCSRHRERQAETSVRFDHEMVKIKPSWPLLNEFMYFFVLGGIFLTLVPWLNARERTTPDKQGLQELFTPHEKTEFFNACKNGDCAVVERLMKEGMNPNVWHSLGWSPLMVAAVNGHLSVIQVLLLYGADPNLQDRDLGYRNDLNSRDEQYKHHQSSRYVDSEDSYTRMVEFSSKLQPRTSFGGFTALHYAVLADELDIVRLLYEYGANDEIKSGAGRVEDLATEVGLAVIKECQSKQRSRNSSLKHQLHEKVTLKEQLQSVLVGQPIAIEQISSVISRMETRWIDDDHPLVLLFMGATGLGKTEMAKQVARYLYPRADNSFVHINLSEYQTKHEAAKFTGAPPGYVGYGASNGDSQLIKTLSKNPNAVVLLDEADKAHPDVLSTLLQLFDEGRLTSGSGKTIECKKALFILTANLATKEIREFYKKAQQTGNQVGGTTGHQSDPASAATEKAMERAESVGGACQQGRQTESLRDFTNRILHTEVKRAFVRDELIGRINEVVIFVPFSDSEVRQLVAMELSVIQRRAARAHGLRLTWEKSVVDLLSSAYNSQFGARALQHEIDRCVMDKLAQAELGGLVKPGDFLHLDIDDRIKGPIVRCIRLYKMAGDNERINLDIHMLCLSEIFNLNNCNNTN